MATLIKSTKREQSFRRRFRDPEPEQMLGPLDAIKAIKKGDRTLFQKAISQLTQEKIIEPQGRSGQAVIHVAAKAKDPWFMHLILDMFPDLDLKVRAAPIGKDGKRKEGGDTPFHLIAKGDGSASVLRRMLEKDPEGALVSDKYGTTPLHKAIRSIEKTLALLRYVDGVPRSYEGNTPLHTAVTAYQRADDYSATSKILPLMFYIYVRKFGSGVLYIKNGQGETPLDKKVNIPRISEETWEGMAKWINKAVEIAERINRKKGTSVPTREELQIIKTILEKERPEELAWKEAA